MITTIILIISMLIALYFFNLYNEEKNKELELKNKEIEHQGKFKLLFENSHFLAAVLDEKGKVLDINDCALEFLGEKIDSLEGKNFWELRCWHNNEKTLLKEMLSKEISSEDINFEINAFSIKNEISIIDFTLSSVKKNNSYIYIATGQDITQRKLREEELKLAYTVFNNTRDGIVITDKHTHILEVNNSFEHITGYKKSELKNKKINILKYHLNDKQFYKNMWNNIINYGYWQGEITNLNKAKKPYTVLLTINCIFNEKNEISSYIGIFSDISEQKEKDKLLKEKEELLFQQSKMAAMGEMLENIAHQWRQPLSLISTAATGIKLQKEFSSLSQEEEFESLDAINQSAQFLSNTINDFRSYLKNDHIKKEFNVSETIEYTLKLINSKLSTMNIKIIKNYEEVSIIGVRNDFVQVLINLLSNAKDALENSKEEEKFIFIDSSLNNSSYCLTIKDNAGGVPKDIIGKVFNPYFTTKHQSQGTGIGLYMSEEIVRNHLEGTLSVKNEKFIYNKKEYLGACFKIDIPL